MSARFATRVLFLGALSLATVLMMVRGMQSKAPIPSSSCLRPHFLDDFLRPDECAAIIKAAEDAGLTRSQVHDLHQGDMVTKYRTSHQVFLPLDHPAVAPFVDNVELLTNIPRSHYEDVQVVRYLPGQKYDSHYDSDVGAPMKEKRSHTVLLYLNDQFTGGETAFPNAHVVVIPKTGMAVWWKNLDQKKEVLPCGFHGAQPVAKGVKYACTIWIHPFPIST